MVAGSFEVVDVGPDGAGLVLVSARISSFSVISGPWASCILESISTFTFTKISFFSGLGVENPSLLSESIVLFLFLLP
jgi:hypothetical protein